MSETGQKGPNRLADNQEFVEAIRGHIVGLIDDGALRVDDIDIVIEVAAGFGFVPLSDKVLLKGDPQKLGNRDSWFVALKSSSGGLFTFVQYEV